MSELRDEHLRRIAEHPLMKMSEERHAERARLLAEASAIETDVWERHPEQRTRVEDLAERAEKLRLEGNALDGAAREQVGEEQRRQREAARPKAVRRGPRRRTGGAATER